MSQSDDDDELYTRLAAGHYGDELVWSVLVVDVAQDRVEALVGALEASGLLTEAILRDPDRAAMFFVQVSESRTHDVASFRARAAAVRACAATHEAVVADWSIRATLRA